MTTVQFSEQEAGTDTRIDSNGVADNKRKRKSRVIAASDAHENNHAMTVLGRAEALIEKRENEADESAKIIDEIDDQILDLQKIRSQLVGDTVPASAPRKTTSSPKRAKSAPKAPAEKAPRLARRSDEEIKDAIENVVLLLGNSSQGMRAEQIRASLSLDKKEIPRILKTAVASKSIKKKGLKRATTYFAV